MFCPHCGQQQVTGHVRFCSRCGFPMDGVIQLLGNGGLIPAYRAPDEPAPVSPKRKGVKQGGMLFLAGILIVAVLGVFASFTGWAFFEVLTALAAVICFVGGPIRMLFAALFEEGAPRPFQPYGQPVQIHTPPMHAPQQFTPPVQRPALTPPPARPQGSWRRPNTAELVNPPSSVTENTTRLLDKEDRTER